MKKEKLFFGKNYTNVVESETAKTIATNKSKTTQIAALSDVNTLVRDYYNQQKQSKFTKVSKVFDIDYKTISKNGGKFLVEKYDLQIYILPSMEFVENGGKVNKNNVLYFSQTDERKLVGSKTSFKDRCKTQIKKLGYLINESDF